MIIPDSSLSTKLSKRFTKATVMPIFLNTLNFFPSAYQTTECLPKYYAALGFSERTSPTLLWSALQHLTYPISLKKEACDKRLKFQNGWSPNIFLFSPDDMSRTAWRRATSVSSRLNEERDMPRSKMASDTTPRPPFFSWPLVTAISPFSVKVSLSGS